jgi:hypothetical protein
MEYLDQETGVDGGDELSPHSSQATQPLDDDDDEADSGLRYQLTNFFIAEHGAFLDSNMVRNRQISTTDFLYPRPGSALSRFLLDATTMVIEEIESAPIDCLDFMRPERHGGMMKPVEVRIKWPECSVEKGSPYKLQVHVRLAYLDHNGAEVVQPFEFVPIGNTEAQIFEEHWVRLMKAGRKGKVWVMVYHQQLRNNLNNARLSEEVDRFNKAPESKQLKDSVEIIDRVWEDLWNLHRWAGESSQPSPLQLLEVMSDDFEVIDANLKVDNRNCCYYRVIPGSREADKHVMVSNFIVQKVSKLIQWENQDGSKASAVEMQLATCASKDNTRRVKTVILDSFSQRNSHTIEQRIKDEAGYQLTCRDFSPSLFSQALQPFIDHYLQDHEPLTALTQFGLAVQLQSQYRSVKKTNPLFLYGNCSFNILDGYQSLKSLQSNGYVCDEGILSTVTKSKFRKAGVPELCLDKDWQRRHDRLRLFLSITIEFHKQNAQPVLWAQGSVWASLFFQDWIKYDKCFPIIYLMSTLAGVGKTSAFYALASSVGLSPEAIGGNKTSESGFLDWVSTHNGLAFFLDDFNARMCNAHQSQTTWKELLKQLFDAKSVVQHDKFRLILSAVILSSNTELCPLDVPTQQRMLTFYFHPISIQDQSEHAALEKKYKEIIADISCLVPDILAMRWNGELDMKYVTEIYQFILKCYGDCSPRVAHNLKKPMYFLILIFSWVNLTQEAFDQYIFTYMDTMLKQYKTTCCQTDMWTKFFYFLDKTMDQCNRFTNDPKASIHWYFE